MGVLLRPQTAVDLPLLTGGHSPYDDFGPRAARAEPAPPELDTRGALSVVAQDQSLAGTVSWVWRQWGPNTASRCPMIGIWLRPTHRGRGIGRDAQAQLLDLFFRHTITHRIEAHTDVGNLAEQRALEAVGFRREGVTRGAQWRDGEYHDGMLYAVLRTDPRPSTIGPALC